MSRFEGIKRSIRDNVALPKFLLILNNRYRSRLPEEPAKDSVGMEVLAFAFLSFVMLAIVVLTLRMLPPPIEAETIATVPAECR